MMSINKWIISVMMALATLMMGCSESDTDNKQAAPELTIQTLEVMVGAEGGSMSVDFELTNPISGSNLLVTPEYDWVSNIKAENGKITFDVAASYEQSERTCRLDVSYPGIYPNRVITVRQAVGNKHSIEIVSKEVNGTYMKLDILPQDKNLSYVFILGNGKYVEENGLMEDDDALWASDMEIFQGFADAFGVDVQSAMSAFMYSGELIDKTFTGLTPETKYVAYAYGFDVQTMTPTTEICRLPLKTPAIQDYVVEFDFDVEVSGYEVVIDITAQGYDGPFFFGAFDAKSCPESMSDDEFRRYCDAAWEEEKAPYSPFFDTPEQGLHFIFNELAYYNSAHMEVELLAETEYVLWACGMDSEAILNTTPQRYYFKTGKVKESDNVLTLSSSNIESRKVTLCIETSNDDQYVAYLTTANDERYVGKSDQEIMEYITSNFNVKYNSGDSIENVSDLMPSTEYTFMAFGCEAGSPTTQLYKYNFTTSEVVYADLNIQIEVSKYYDVNEVSKLDPRWEQYAGDTAIVPVKVTVDDDAVAFFVSADTSADFESFTYEDTIQRLIAIGEETEKEAVYLLDFFREYVFYAAAKDANGNYSKVAASKAIKITYDGCSPASEFVNSQTNSVSMAAKLSRVYVEDKEKLIENKLILL